MSSQQNIRIIDAQHAAVFDLSGQQSSFLKAPFPSLVVDDAASLIPAMRYSSDFRADRLANYLVRLGNKDPRIKATLEGTLGVLIPDQAARAPIFKAFSQQSTWPEGRHILNTIYKTATDTFLRGKLPETLSKPLPADRQKLKEKVRTILSTLPPFYIKALEKIGVEIIITDDCAFVDRDIEDSRASSLFHKGRIVIQSHELLKKSAREIILEEIRHYLDEAIGFTNTRRDRIINREIEHIRECETPEQYEAHLFMVAQSLLIGVVPPWEYPSNKALEYLVALFRVRDRFIKSSTQEGLRSMELAILTQADKDPPKASAALKRMQAKISLASSGEVDDATVKSEMQSLFPQTYMILDEFDRAVEQFVQSKGAAQDERAR